jgi:filamentous hemagglutinin
VRDLGLVPADQIAAKLGLPAEQAVRGSQLGFDVYSMKPLSGADAQAFTSQVAPVQQGAYSAPGGAQQVLIPNRSQWTDPNANKIGEIKGSF